MRYFTEEQFTLNQHITINTVIYGHNRPDFSRNSIICLSGFGCDHYNFLWLAEQLCRDFNMVLIDNRGTGKSSPAYKNYEIKDLAHDALEVVNALNLTTFHIAGISMGGFIAQELALMAKERVKSLSLLCTSSGGDDFISIPQTTEEELRTSFALEEPLRSNIILQATVHPKVVKQKQELFQEILKLRTSHPADVEQAIFQKRAIDLFLSKSLPLAQLTIPVLVMTGANDRHVNPENSKRISRKIKSSKLIMVEEADHQFFLEKADEVSDKLRTFWESLTS
ncbi:alpha/beta fold hydrolase [Vibrio quintilis]|uniref:Lipase 1 n=1 Tax=Vibrio quintilis TaxID=1117707 RepID=A0A1M7YPV0_9VIBR|nr:alpha/beta hydrolase [Vibrio quintilis]SHO54651.1 Lipase 1 precursor [Vibrio quintilis]